MRESGFPWPWSGPQNRRLTLLVVAWIAALNLWALFSIHALPLARPSDWNEDVTRRAPLFARYDSGWYNTIAERGYQAPPVPGKQSEHAFFPLYPMTARVLHLATGLDGLRAGLLVSYAALLFAIPLLVEEARERFGEARARAALPLLFVYPVAFFLASVCTESLFLLLALPVLTGTATGKPRYTLTIAPGHFAAAALCEGRPWLNWPWLGASLFGLLAESALFVNWHFIS